jgi:hypothetical protein
MKSLLALLLILLSTVISISNIQDDDINSGQNEFLLHAESSERLISIMQQLLLVSHSDNIVEPINLNEEDIIDLVEAVEELLFYSELMSVQIPATDLEESKSVIFRAMASQLYDETLNIQQLTENYDLHIIDNSQEHILNEAFERLSRTCNACHQLFRDN